MLTTQKQVRAAFWREAEENYPYRVTKRRLSSGDYSADTRAAFVDFVDVLHKSGEISEALAQRVTL